MFERLPVAYVALKSGCSISTSAHLQSRGGGVHNHRTPGANGASSEFPCDHHILQLPHSDLIRSTPLTSTSASLTRIMCLQYFESVLHYPTPNPLKSGLNRVRPAETYLTDLRSLVPRKDVGVRTSTSSVDDVQGDFLRWSKIAQWRFGKLKPTYCGTGIGTKARRHPYFLHACRRCRLSSLVIGRRVICGNGSGLAHRKISLVALVSFVCFRFSL